MRRSAFRDQEVVVISYMIDVRSLRRGRVCHRAACQQRMAFSEQSARGEFQFLHPDMPRCGIRIWVGSAVAQIIDFPLVKYQRGIDSLCPLHDDGIGPGPCRIIRPYVEVHVVPVGRVAHQRRDHVEPSLVIEDRRGIDAPGWIQSVQRQLFRSIQHMAYLLPMYQVPGMEDRNAGIIFKCGCDQIIIFSPPAYRRIRIESRQNRILKFHDNAPLFLCI